MSNLLKGSVEHRVPEDGLQVFEELFKSLSIDPFLLLQQTSYWVSRETFMLMPVWYPELHRGAKRFKEGWSEPSINKKRNTQVFEQNESAQTALFKALGGKGESQNWTCCHIWGSEGFIGRNPIVTDRRFYSCVANMCLVPTPLKALTDAVPNLKTALRILSFNLYGWVCDVEPCAMEANLIKEGLVPASYPTQWPKPDGKTLPQNIIPLNEVIRKSAQSRNTKIQKDLDDLELKNYPRKEVIETLGYWSDQFNKILNKSA